MKPWKIERLPRRRCYEIRTDEPGLNEHNGDLLATVPNTGAGSAKTRQLARLLAAAPALLEACKSAANLIHFFWHQDSELGPGSMEYTLHGERLSFDFDILRKAIAKASGKEQ